MVVIGYDGQIFRIRVNVYGLPERIIDTLYHGLHYFL